LPAADEMTMRRIGVMQEWPSRTKRLARQASADAQADGVVRDALAQRAAVEFAAGNAWIDVWAAETERSLLQAVHAEAGRAARLAAARLASAAGGTGDALAAQVVAAESYNELRRSEAQVQAARATLVRWLPDLPDVALAASPDFSTLRVEPERLRARLDQHAALQVWQSRLRSADAAVALARAERRPDLAFAVSYGARSDLSDMLMAEVRIGLPLFARRRQDRGVAARFAEREAVEAEREHARREQQALLERELAEWESLRDERQRYEEQLLPLARDRTAIALAAYGAGAAIEPWIQARRDELATRRRYVATLAGQGRAWLALDTTLAPAAPDSEVLP
jgi:cobalt-zinc-cadmium efflux system outer membrane protein